MIPGMSELLSAIASILSGQDKPLRDIRSMIRLLPELDTTMVDQWAARYGVGDAWRLVRA